MIYGIEHGGVLNSQAVLRIAVPSVCAREAIEGLTDVALIPVAEVPNLGDGGSVITDYCISADGDVDTVALLSNSPLRSVHTVYLDWHSRTSVQLVRVLSRELWGNFNKIKWVELDKSATSYESISSTLGQGEAIVAIGDKVFDIQHNFCFKTDLAAEWKRLTGLPFVFAVWVATNDRGRALEATLNEALKWGVNHIDEAIEHNIETLKVDRSRAYEYLTRHIRFELTPSGRRAMSLFWEKIITPG